MNKKVFITLLLILLLIPAFLTYARNNESKLQSGTILQSSRRIKSFNLTSTTGKEFTRSNLRGQWSLVFFGFTHCPTVCPTALARLTKAYQSLKKQNIKELPQVVFISLDPKQDTPAIMRKYLKNFNQNFIGVTGKKEEIDKLTKQLGVFYAKSKKTDTGNYISHSTRIFVIAPNGKWVGLINPPYDGDTIAHDFILIQKDY